jgi:hypothetical protein
MIRLIRSGRAELFAGAGMIDIDQERGAVANATAPGLGTAN